MSERGTGKFRACRRDVLFVLMLAAIAFGVRSCSLVDRVFTEDGVILQGVDPWIHLREVQALTRDLNQSLLHDPYLIFPERTGVPVGPLFDTTAAVVVRFFFDQDATDRQIGQVCALLPPIAAALTIIVIFLLGRRLSGRLGGYVAASVAAVCPSLFFHRSLLGAADHHVLEVLLSNLHILTILGALGVGALQSARDADIATLRRRRTLFSLASGLVLTLYLWTWIGGVYWVALVTVGAVVQYGSRHLRGESTRHLAHVYLPGMMVAGAIVALTPVSYPLQRLQIVGICYSVGIIFVMHSLCWLLDRYRARRLWFPLIMVGLAACVVGGWSLFQPQLFHQMTWLASLLWIDGPASAIVETSPMFTKEGAFSLEPVWLMFSTGFPLALAGLAVIAVRACRGGGDGEILLTTWTLTNFVAMAGQNRFGYYASTNIALLVAILVVLALSISARPVKKSETSAKRGRNGARWVGLALAAGTLALAIGPGVATLRKRATEFTGPSNAFVEALSWIRNETPEPFGDPSVYWYPDRAGRTDAARGAEPYGVLSSWDYGYWITAIARRIPCSNPTQAGAAHSGRFFTSPDVAESTQVVQDVGARYVLLDSSMVAEPLSLESDLSSKFYSMVGWADKSLEDYYEWFEIPGVDGPSRSIPLFYPSYFKSSAVRLYAFGGNAVEASRPMVVRYQNITDDAGREVKRVVEMIECPTYEEALATLDASTDTPAAIVSDSPFKSCTPLERLDDYRLVFDTHWLRVFLDGTVRPEVRVFEYVGQ